jgi:hypothetical protein
MSLNTNSVLDGYYLQDEIIAGDMQLFTEEFYTEKFCVPKKYVDNVHWCINALDNVQHGGK